MRQNSESGIGKAQFDTGPRQPQVKSEPHGISAMSRLQRLFGNHFGRCVLVRAESRPADLAEGYELGETAKASRFAKETLDPTAPLVRRTLSEDGLGTFPQRLGAFAVIGDLR